MNAPLKPPQLYWTDIGAASDIPKRGARRVPTRQGDIAVFHTGEGEFYALFDRCPHKQGPLSQGIVQGRAVACPLHNWLIDLATGNPLGADEGKGCTPTVLLEVQEGRLLLGLAGV